MKMVNRNKKKRKEIAKNTSVQNKKTGENKRAASKQSEKSSV